MLDAGDAGIDDRRGGVGEARHAEAPGQAGRQRRGGPDRRARAPLITADRNLARLRLRACTQLRQP